ncbi:MAG: tRNA (adenosine(37)-N6)-dimethylallyltransferase MiaA [Lentimicrobiaceae bacterium]|nr:tRNA (adenosine(37)-N6)-dimethylallyltransferase MiaA [Lentimicrobiaceae bacterium]
MKTSPDIVILGPTATGKTRLAALVADHIHGEIISADSRQVYRDMDEGTGKDLNDYIIDGRQVPYHLVNLADAGQRYNIFDYSRDYQSAVSAIRQRGNPVIVCGGSGMYLETALGLYNLQKAEEDATFREEAKSMSSDELLHILAGLRPLHNTTDSIDRERLIRAIEVARSSVAEDQTKPYSLKEHVAVFGIALPRNVVRERITLRLKARLERGMLNEVKELLNKGVEPGDLIYYGLEYKYLTLFLSGEMEYEQMVRSLNTAIHQFAKRQMTWYRRMERRGVNIQWLDGMQGVEWMKNEILKKIKGK